MEEICSALSAKLSEAAGVYAVFYRDELLDVLPEDSRDRETLEAAIFPIVRMRIASPSRFIRI